MQASVPRRKKQRSRHKGQQAYAIFRGRNTGVYVSWAEAELQVNGFPGAVYQGYQTHARAIAAYQYAQQRGWTSSVNDPAPAFPNTHVNLRILPSLIQPTLPVPTPVTPDDTPRSFYCVYRGVNPGIYLSLCVSPSAGISSFN